MKLFVNPFQIHWHISDKISIYSRNFLLLNICYVILFIICLLSCKQNNGTPPSNRVDSNTTVQSNFKKVQVDTSIFFKQARECSFASINGDAEIVWKYTYPESINFLVEQWKKSEPNVNINDFKKSMEYNLSKMKGAAKKGVLLTISNEKIERIVNVNESIIVVVYDNTSELTFKGKIIETKNEKNIGISIDQGNNWTFMSMGEYAKQILQRTFSNKIIEEILG